MAATGTLRDGIREVLEIEAGVEGELAGGVEGRAFGLVFLVFDLDGVGGGRNEFGERVILTEICGLEAAVLELIDGFGNAAIG